MMKRNIFSALAKWLDIITEDLSEEEVGVAIQVIGKMTANACEYLGDYGLAAKFR